MLPSQTTKYITCILNFFGVEISIKLQVPSGTPSLHLPHNEVTELCHLKVNKVRIQATTDEPINMFEFQVIYSDTNIAQGKSATQSSDLKAWFGAGNAVDGNINTFSHTKDSNAWFEVDLGKASPVESVLIKNRWCRSESDPFKCLCRLSSAKLELIDATGKEISSLSIGNTCGQGMLEFAFDPSSEFCETSSVVASAPSPPSNRKLWQERQLAKRPTNC